LKTIIFDWVEAERQRLQLRGRECLGAEGRDIQGEKGMK
jgi:hypothetical protein